MHFRLKLGWSQRTSSLDKPTQSEQISTDEHKKILEVIEKAEAEERAEKKRVK